MESDFSESGKMSSEPTTVFVGNLAWTTTQDDLRSIMSSVGIVVNAEVKYFGMTNRSKGWGLVQFGDPASARAAVTKFDSFELQGRAIHVRLDRSQLESFPGVSVYVGNLPWAMKDDALHEIFKQFDVYDCQIMRNLSGRSRGFALLKFTNSSDALKAIDSVHGKNVEGRILECRVNHEKPKASPQPLQTRKVIASNLTRATTDEMLLAHFSQCGEVLSAAVQKSRARRSKGWGIIEYVTIESAILACELLNGTILGGNKIEVRVDRK